MLLFLSDLHLADRREASSADVASLFGELRSVLERAAEKGVDPARLVLLGDIFELLKSERWLETDARPWQPLSGAGVEVVSQVFEAIVAEHAVFFSGLDALRRDFPRLTLEYLPGNHDRELGTALGVQARRRWCELAALPAADGEAFPSYLADPQHGVLARHGHEWDAQNRYSEGLAAVGDAVVIELVTRLPLIVRQALPGRAGLGFLDELDNVRPQHPRAMAHWLLAGLAALDAACRQEARAAVAEALRQAVGHFRSALSTGRFESVTGNVWVRA